MAGVSEGQVSIFFNQLKLTEAPRPMPAPLGSIALGSGGRRQKRTGSVLVEPETQPPRGDTQCGAGSSLSGSSFKGLL